MTGKKTSISRSITLMGLVSILCIVLTGVLVALFMGKEVRKDIEISKRQAEAKIATLSIESHFNLVSRIARNIMLGSDVPKDLARYDKSIKIMENNFDILESTANGEKDKQLIAESRVLVMDYLKVAYVFCQELADVPPQERPSHYKRFGQVATPVAEKAREKFTEISRFTRWTTARCGGRKGQGKVY